MGGLYYLCFLTILFGFSAGAQIIIGRRNGEKNYRAIGPVMIQGTIFLLMLAVVFVGLSYFFTDGIIRVMVSSEVIREATVTFLKWRMPGLIFDAFFLMFRVFYVGITKTKILTAGAIIMAVANIILDWLLIFGKCGFPEMGLEGAAIASVISIFISALFFVTYTFYATDRKKYGFTRIKSIDFQLLKSVLNISVYMMFQYFISMGTFFLFFVVIERQGQHALAVANIVRSIYIVMFIPVNAFSATSNTLVSNIIGEKRTNEVMPLIYRITRMSVIILTVSVLLLCFFSKTVLSLYTNDISLINGSLPSIYVITVAMILSSIANVFFNGVSGTGNTKSALILELSVLALYIVYIYFVGIHFKLPVHICFTAEILYFIGILTGSVLYLRFADWQKKII